MTIDKKKVNPAAIEDDEVAAMNVKGREENGKYILEVVEIDGKEQYGEKEIMSPDLTIGTEIKVLSGRGEANKKEDEDKGIGE